MLNCQIELWSLTASTVTMVTCDFLYSLSTEVRANKVHLQELACVTVMRPKQQTPSELVKTSDYQLGQYFDFIYRRHHMAEVIHAIT